MEDDFDETLDGISNSYAQKYQKYTKLQQFVQAELTLIVKDINKLKTLFTVTTKDLLKDNLKYSKHILMTWIQILEKHEVEDQVSELHQALVDSAVTNMKLLNKVSPSYIHDDLKDLSYEVMKLYPKEIIINIATEHRLKLYSLIASVLNTKCAVSIAETPSFFEDGDLKISIMIFDILKMVIEALPPDTKQGFMTEGLFVWFSFIIPFSISLMICNKLTSHPIFAELLDLITNELVHIDYMNNREWKKILKCICRPDGYPELMKTSLRNKSDNWPIMWCIVVKLLKNQITCGKPGHELPLNYILPVVENAFKMDAESRCRAFHCWQVLAKYSESISNDNKRIALLMIPLEANNAKVEEVALAKFTCWWYIIKRFRKNLITCKYTLLMKFLRFCLGTPQEESKEAKIPQFKQIAALGIEAFLNIVGHAPDCEGCIEKTIPELDTKILNGEILTSNLSKWLIHLKVVTIILANSENRSEAKKQVTCIWKSFFNVIAWEVNKNELTCSFLKKSLEIIQEHKNTTEFLFHAISSIFFSNNKIAEQLIGNMNADNVLAGPISFIIELITHPHCYNYISRHTETSSINTLDPIIKLAVMSDPEALILKHMLLRLPGKAEATIIWEAITAYIYENNANVTCYGAVLKWPLEKNADFLDESRAASHWKELYNYSKLKFSNMKEFDKDLLTLLPSYTNCILFPITMLCTIIKCGDQHLIPRAMEMLHEKLETENKLQSIISVFNDCINSILTKLCANHDITTAKFTMSSINITLQSMLEEHFNDEDARELMMMDLLIIITKIITNKNYSQFSSLIAETITKITNSNVSKSCIKLARRILETILKDIMSDDENEITENVVETTKDIKYLDNIKSLSKDAEKVLENKENSSSDCVVKVVVENGEEVVVIDSNKKFNPRKLTEHQKEMLQRKRDNIPALYQDLSQSQDEFKNKYWKNGISKINESSNENSKETENNAKDVSKKSPVKSVNKTISIPTMTPPANKKSQLRFKDRVMLNVKNLLHKGDVKIVDANAYKEGEVTTPNKPIPNKSDIVNSAPASISTFRSSRIRRKPKKYDLDFEQTLPTKRRNSITIDNRSDLALKKIPTVNEESSSSDETKSTGTSSNDELNNIESEDKEKFKKIETIPESIEIQYSEKYIPETMEINDKPGDIMNQCKDLSVLLDRADLIEISTPKSQKIAPKSKSTGKKEQRNKQSRLVKELAIDMVDGNPFLDKPIKNRLTRQTGADSKRRRVDPNLQSKLDTKDSKVMKRAKHDKNDEKMESTSESGVTSDSLIDLQSSEDFIESSQESTSSIKSVNKKRTLKKQISNDILSSKDLIVDVSDCVVPLNCNNDVIDTTNTVYLVDGNSKPNIKCSDTNEQSISNNNTALMETQTLIESQSLTKSNSTSKDLTASIDTEPMLSGEQILVSDSSVPIINLNSPDESVGPETMEIAEADTEPVETSIRHDSKVDVEDLDPTVTIIEDDINVNDITNTSISCLSSPFKDEHKRNEVFLNNTLNISPIQTMISKRDEETTPEKSQDFVVIKLTSPVQSNGEPIYENDSPEIFTNDKISPSKNEQSPTKIIAAVANNSPSSLTLKKNRTQVRPTGRAAQMLSLCQVDKLLCFTEKFSDENKKAHHPTPANDSTSTEIMESFLKLKRPLPSADCSPIGPILKRKLENDDDVTMSPASKKKRVSFHDPPVSTTIAVQKYIEVNGSPSSKHNEKPQRNYVKSPRQLEALFKSSLATTVIKTSSDIEVTAVDEGNDCETIQSAQIEESSILIANDNTTISDIELDQTPQVEIINIQQLNNIDPICPELINCTEPIDLIAGALSSPSMKILLIKALDGKVNTIGDLAKLTELEANRLCIKAPKVQTVKKALYDYLANNPQDTGVILPEENDATEDPSSSKIFIDAESQSTVLTNVKVIQTDEKNVADVLVQTKESSFVSTDEVIQSSIKDRPDFIGKVHQTKEIMNTLPLNSILDLLQTKVTSDLDRSLVLDKTLSQVNGINFIQKYLSDKFSPTNIVMLCSELLKSLHVKMDV